MDGRTGSVCFLSKVLLLLFFPNAKNEVLEMIFWGATTVMLRSKSKVIKGREINLRTLGIQFQNLELCPFPRNASLGRSVANTQINRIHFWFSMVHSLLPCSMPQVWNKANQTWFISLSIRSLILFGKALIQLLKWDGQNDPSKSHQYSTSGHVDETERMTRPRSTWFPSNPSFICPEQ